LIYPTLEIEQCLDDDAPLIIMINNLKILFVLIIIASIIYLYNLTSLETYNELYEEKYDRSMAYKGSSTRIKNKFKQALSGEHIKIGIVGGSISAGRKLEDAIKESYHGIVSNWWNKQFPNTTVVNGAMPSLDSSYFAYCYNKHIPNDLDIVFVEFSVNDGSVFPDERGSGDIANTRHMELLIRSLLQMPKTPAVILVSFFNFRADHYFDGQEAHLPVANYYNIPYISLKNVYFDYLVRFPDSKDILFSDDNVHANKYGHQMMADFIIHYFGEQLKMIDSPSTVDDLPLIDMWSSRKQHFSEFQSECQIFINDTTYHTNGWHLTNINKEKFYIAADEPGAHVTFSINTNKGNVYIHALKSNQFNLGNVWCWADDNKQKGRELSGYWHIIPSVGETMLVAEKLVKGQHFIHCEVLSKSNHPNNGTHFRIIAIFSD
jgi:lysophospholipase L1-like esterase